MLLVNTQGFNSKIGFNKEIIKRMKPTFAVFSEINMRASQAETIYDNFIGYASTSQTPDLKLSTPERLKWKPTQGVSLLYNEEWLNKVEKVRVTTRAAITQYKLNKIHVITIAAYLPTLSSSNLAFKTALDEIKTVILKAQDQYKEKLCVLMGGDLNIDPKHHNSRKLIFNNFLQDLHLFHWVPEHPSFCHSAWKTWSHLDGIVVSPNVMVEQICLVDDDMCPGNTSDHIPVMVRVKLPTKIQKLKKKEVPENTKYLMSKKVNWSNVNNSMYESLSTSLINSMKLTINDNLPWGVKSKMVIEALAHCARLSEIKPEKTTR